MLEKYLNKEVIIEEKLYYMCDKQRGVLYQLKKENDKTLKKYLF